jgi:hypothetical protein
MRGPARGYIRKLPIELDRAREVAYILAQDLDDPDVNLVHAPSLVSDLTECVGRMRSLARVDIEAARGLDRTLNRVSGRSFKLNRTLDRVRDPDRVLSLPDHDLDLARSLVRDIQARLDRAAVRERERGLARGSRRNHGAIRVAPSASRLLTVAITLLPAADRARYTEEYRSELWEITHAGGRRRTQLAYSARQVMSAWRLRAELRVRRRRGATS